MRQVALALTAALAPMTAAADGLQRIACTFTVECLDTDACTETEYEMAMTYMPDPSGKTFVEANPTMTPPDPFTVEVSDVSGDFLAAPIAGGVFGAPMQGFVAFNTEDTQRLLTIADGLGRYSVHMREEGLALYYEGPCEEIG